MSVCVWERERERKRVRKGIEVKKILTGVQRIAFNMNIEVVF